MCFIKGVFVSALKKKKTVLKYLETLKKELKLFLFVYYS